MRAKGLCSTHYNDTNPACRGSRNGNAETRRRNLRKKTARRRAKMTDPEAELIDRDMVGDRDGWRCGICHLKVAKGLAYPHPKSPSLDHIVPLSLGGKHAYINVRITHLDCNVRRNNKINAEQLLLIG